jgi:hypothetical protein
VRARAALERRDNACSTDAFDDIGDAETLKPLDNEARVSFSSKPNSGFRCR